MHGLLIIKTVETYKKLACYHTCLVLQHLQFYSIVLIQPWHQVLTVIVWIMLVRYGKSNVSMLLYHALLLIYSMCEAISMNPSRVCSTCVRICAESVQKHILCVIYTSYSVHTCLHVSLGMTCNLVHVQGNACIQAHTHAKKCTWSQSHTHTCTCTHTRGQHITCRCAATRCIKSIYR